MAPPSGLRSLAFDASFYQSLEKVTLPRGLQNLTFGLIFNRSLEKMALPRGLLSLSFGRAVASTRAW